MPRIAVSSVGGELADALQDARLSRLNHWNAHAMNPTTLLLVQLAVILGA
ncbi:MAG: cation:proton antiporter, partial [Xanthomonas perforans]|nr:cation:proton antiporter [Xanthomonas perforans]